MSSPADFETERMLQCPARATNGTCIALNTILGWTHGLPLSECDVCWSKGGIWGEEGDAWRREKAAGVIAVVSKPGNREKQHREVVVALTLNHVPLEKRAEFLSEPSSQVALMRGVSWSLVVRTWEDASKWVANLTEFLSSMASRGLTNKRVSASVFFRRRLSCTGLDGRGKRKQAPCPFFKIGTDGHEYCGACGCKENPLARLDDGDYSKLEYPHLECPIRMPGFSNEMGVTNVPE